MTINGMVESGHHTKLASFCVSYFAAVTSISWLMVRLIEAGFSVLASTSHDLKRERKGVLVSVQCIGKRDLYFYNENTAGVVH